MMRPRALVFIGIALALGWGAFRLWLILGGVVVLAPAFSDVRAGYRASDLLLLDRRGEVIQEVRTDPRRRRLGWTPLDEISPALRSAVLASEDRRFFAHGGVDGRAVVAAGLQRMAGGHLRGASTITMQLATLLDPELHRRGGPRTLHQKWRQMRLAWRIEAGWTKPEILEAYLNLVSFRGELEGVAAASILFGVAPHGIGAAEGAVLAVLLRAPNAGPESVARRAWALVESRRDGPPREVVRAAAAQALASPAGTGPRVTLAPHAAARLLGPGAAARTSSDVRTTLDGALQRMAGESLRRHLLAVRAEHVQDGAVLVVDNASGEVLAYVGGSGDLGSARHVDGIRARRQAGSTLKPFLYAEALDRRLLTAASLLEDTPLDLAVAGGLYRPRNYDEGWKGLVSVRTPLASSLNVPAVRALDLVGEEAAVELLRRLGFDGLRESGDYYGPSMALGSADVSLWELVNAYRALARGGTWSPLRLGADEAAGALRRVYSDRAAFLVSSILADRESRSLTFGLENPLATRFWTAVKTGTSKEMRDNWCVGYSRRYTVGVWVGNFGGEPMRNVSGVTGAAPVWTEVMAWLHGAVPSAPPAAPAGVVAAPVAFPGAVEPPRLEWFLAGTEPPTAAPAIAGGHPRIIAPVSGTIIALDPDIPEGRERLVFEATDARESLRWVLDGDDLGSARELHVWRPVRGRHALELVDGHGRVVDRVSFDVRGVPRAAHAEPAR